MGSETYYRLADILNKSSLESDLEVVRHMVANEQVQLWYFADTDWYNVTNLGITAFQNGTNEVALHGTFYPRSEGKPKRFGNYFMGFPPPEVLETLEDRMVKVDLFCVWEHDKNRILAKIKTGKAQNKGFLNKKQFNDLNDRYISVQAGLFYLAAWVEKNDPKKAISANFLTTLVTKDEKRFWGKAKPPGKSTLNSLFGDTLSGEIIPFSVGESDEEAF